MNRAVHNLKRFRDALAHSGDVEGNSSIFWEIDRTENPLRMRCQFNGYARYDWVSKSRSQICFGRTILVIAT